MDERVNGYMQLVGWLVVYGDGDILLDFLKRKSRDERSTVQYVPVGIVTIRELLVFVRDGMGRSGWTV